MLCTRKPQTALAFNYRSLQRLAITDVFWLLQTMTDCPTCRVPINPFNMQCPNCNCTFELPAKQSNHFEQTQRLDPSTLVVSPTTDLPPFCHLCNSPTNKFLKITGKDTSHSGHRDSDEPTIPWPVIVKIGTLPMIAAATLISGLAGLAVSIVIAIFVLSLKLNTKNTESYDVTVKVPTCKECGQFTRKPINTSWEKNSMLIDVHPEYGARCTKYFSK